MSNQDVEKPIDFEDELKSCLCDQKKEKKKEEGHSLVLDSVYPIKKFDSIEIEEMNRIFSPHITSDEKQHFLFRPAPFMHTIYYYYYFFCHASCGRPVIFIVLCVDSSPHRCYECCRYVRVCGFAMEK